MMTIDAIFRDRSDLRGAVAVENELFLEGTYSLGVGTTVLVRMKLPTISDTFVVGTVQWRRLGNGQNPWGRSGIGIRLGEEYRERVAFLRRWADSSGEDSGRRESRFPLQKALRIGVGPLGGERWLGARTADVSLHGAQLLQTTGLVAGGLCVIAPEHLGEGVETLRARVAWVVGGRAGLRLQLDERVERLAWARVVDAAVKAVEQHRVAVRNPSVPPRSGAG